MVVPIRDNTVNVAREGDQGQGWPLGPPGLVAGRYLPSEPVRSGRLHLFYTTLRSTQEDASCPFCHRQPSAIGSLPDNVPLIVRPASYLTHRIDFLGLLGWAAYAIL